MIFIALGIVLLASAAVMLWMVVTAPEGWEDADGFHTGPEPFDHPRRSHTDRLAHSGRSR